MLLCIYTEVTLAGKPFILTRYLSVGASCTRPQFTHVHSSIIIHLILDRCYKLIFTYCKLICTVYTHVNENLRSLDLLFNGLYWISKFQIRPEADLD